MARLKPVWCLIVGLALLPAVTGCTNTFRGVERDMDNLFANRGAGGNVASPSPASADESAGDEWVDPR